MAHYILVFCCMVCFVLGFVIAEKIKYFKVKTYAKKCLVKELSELRNQKFYADVEKMYKDDSK